MKNSGQKKTVKQNNKRMTEEKTDKKEFGISLRIQLIVGFAVPILFLIGVGVISYRNASSGMIENYENSAINALDMTMECLERGFSECRKRAGAGEQHNGVILCAGRL